MKILKNVTSILAAIMIAVNVFTCSTASAEEFVSSTNDTASLYISRDKVVTGSKISLGLSAGQKGKSNEVKLNVSGIPDDAELTKITIVGTNASMSGDGLTIATSVTLVAPNGRKYTNSWGVGNKIEITNFYHEETNGDWTLYFEGQNVASSGYSVLSYTPRVTFSYRS